MDRFTTANLRAYYGKMLTERQNEFLRLRYDEDLSYGEIAEMYSVSRQAVLDAIRTGERVLSECEEKLMLASRDEGIIDRLNSALESLANGDSERVNEQIKGAIALLEE